MLINGICGSLDLITNKPKLTCCFTSTLNHLSTIPAIVFLLELSHTFATTDSALALTTSFVSISLDMDKNGES
jgi:hypothetical protein